MRQCGRSLIAGTTALLAGCSGSGGNSPPNPAQSSNLTVTTTGLPGGTVGAANISAVAASGGTTTYTYSAGSLPNGLTMSSTTGMITGTPAQSSVGTASATIKVTDSSRPSPQSATATLSIKIQPGFPRRDYLFSSWRHCWIALSINHAGGLWWHPTVYLGAELG